MRIQREPLTLSMEKCSLREVILEAVWDLEVVHGNRFIPEFEGEMEGYWNREALKRIIDNLGSNGIKYGAAERPITVRASSAGNQVVIAVHNEGAALNAADRQDIFEIFKRSRRAERSAQKGWGLGLTVVRGMAEAHGGTVAVESFDSAGTTFSIFLPVDSRGAEGLENFGVQNQGKFSSVEGERKADRLE